MNLCEPTANVVEVGGASDVLGVIPHMLGFHPDSSLVVVCLHGGRQRSGLVMRLDLPDEEVYEPCAQEICARAEFESADAVLLVCYTDEPDSADVLPHQGLVDAIARAFAASPVDVVEALLVRDGRWWSYICRRPSCCSPEGAPLPDPLTGPAGQIAAQAAVRGRALLASREDLAASVQGPRAADLGAVRETFDRVAAQLTAECRDEGMSIERERTVATLVAVLARYTAGEPDVTDDEVARICLGLADAPARDQIASLAVADPGAWIALLVELARRTPDGSAAPICTTLAWVAYQYGDGALANVALDRALADEPRYSLALMLRDSLDRQVSPSIIRSVSRTVRAVQPP